MTKRRKHKLVDMAETPKSSATTQSGDTAKLPATTESTSDSPDEGAETGKSKARASDTAKHVQPVTIARGPNDAERVAPAAKVARAPRKRRT